MTDDGKIACQIDGVRVHSVPHHLKEKYPEWTLDRYRREYPDAPLMSALAESRLKEIRARKVAEAAVAPSAGAGVEIDPRLPFHEVFGFGVVPAAMSGRGTPIMIEVMSDLGEDAAALVPDIDPAYVFNIELTKKAIAAAALSMPLYFWGYHGTGKTTLHEQVAARTGRPFMRVQHTVNTEESHIVGQWIIKDGSTEFQLGPLPVAMREGYTYCADEYDFAQPSVLSVYQAVLEGKPLVIKEAPVELRVIRPHKNFRFVATGNTNGGGDETGLYQGTAMQNAANFSRFGIVEEVGYMDPKIEEIVVSNQARVDREDAKLLVAVATEVRKAFKGGDIAMPISPRELIAAAKIGVAFFKDWKGGLRSAYLNRLSRVDRDVVEGYLQRVYGA